MRSLGDSKELEEERRLAYVGITRARERLYVSRAIVRSAWGAPSYNPPSRFLEELPTELVHWNRVDPVITTAPGDGYRSSRASQGGFGAAPSLLAAATRPGVRSPGNREVVHLSAGDRVTHDKFGLGTVVSTSGHAEKAEATIDFGAEGTKRLLLRYAPVEKL
jgi:DNA helicase-2/ATP-dependent DNA helicase PcrA